MTSSYYPNEVFTTFAFLGFLACIIPLPWHLHAWNAGTCLYMIWVAIGCLNLFVNSIVWKGNAINWAPIWCDISARVVVGVHFAVPVTSLCISRRIYGIATAKTVTTKSSRRRSLISELCIGIGIPVLGMVLQYVPQGHRFDIFEDFGCMPYTHPTWVAFALLYLPPILFGLASAVYGILSIIALRKNRAQLEETLLCHTNLSFSQYIRLMCLASVDALCTVPIATWVAVSVFKDGDVPYFTWASTHVGFSRVGQLPAVYWHANPSLVTGLEFSRWITISCAALFFGFFGLSDEAIRNYRLYASFVKRVGVNTWSKLKGTSSEYNNTRGGRRRTADGDLPMVALMPFKEQVVQFPRPDTSTSEIPISKRNNDDGGQGKDTIGKHSFV